jgi:hypothetical protein
MDTKAMPTEKGPLDGKPVSTVPVGPVIDRWGGVGPRWRMGLEDAIACAPPTRWWIDGIDVDVAVSPDVVDPKGVGATRSCRL